MISCHKKHTLWPWLEMSNQDKGSLYMTSLRNRQTNLWIILKILDNLELWLRNKKQSSNYLENLWQSGALNSCFVRFASTDFAHLPVVHVGDTRCEPYTAARCDASSTTSYRAPNGHTYAYCCSEHHKPTITIHPNAIECDC